MTLFDLLPLLSPEQAISVRQIDLGIKDDMHVLPLFRGTTSLYLGSVSGMSESDILKENGNRIITSVSARTCAACLWVILEESKD